jgi:hypothetical protein
MSKDGAIALVIGAKASRASTRLDGLDQVPQEPPVFPDVRSAARTSGRLREMKNFANAEFSPEVIDLMTIALEAAVATLPEPVHSSHVNALAESILRTAGAGERDILNLQRIALMELQLATRN